MSEVSEKVLTPKVVAIERVLEDYFAAHVAPVMETQKETFLAAQRDEANAWANTTAGRAAIMAGVPSSMGARISGLSWSGADSLTYLNMCVDAVKADSAMASDIETLKASLREELRSTVGNDEYASRSAILGTDVASQFVDERITAMMVEKLTEMKVPKNSIEYVAEKAIKETTFGSFLVDCRSQLDKDIDLLAEKNYNPTPLERDVAQTLSAAMDASAVGGIGAFSVATWFTLDIWYRGVKSSNTSPQKEYSKTALAASLAEYEQFKQEAAATDPRYNDRVQRLAGKLNNQVYDLAEPVKKMGPVTEQEMDVSIKTFAERAERVSGKTLAEAREEAASRQATEEASRRAEQGAYSQQQAGTEKSARSSADGWEGTIWDKIGLGGLSKNVPLSNFGYIVAMLPNLMVSILTGKNDMAKDWQNLVPLASVFGGLFMKNPVLKMLMIGYGGFTLLNKSAEQVNAAKKGELYVGKGGRPLGVSQQGTQQTVYRRYDDEPLNARITDVRIGSLPSMGGAKFTAKIDDVEYYCIVSKNVYDAYQTGALPLNTLANTVLAKKDAQDAASLAAAKEYETRVEQQVGRGASVGR